MLLEQKFTYKGHKIHIRTEEEYEDPTTVKAYHHITQPDGTETIANISPYDTHQETVRLFIDLGMPKSFGFNWRLEDLQKKARNENH